MSGAIYDPFAKYGLMLCINFLIFVAIFFLKVKEA